MNYKLEQYLWFFVDHRQKNWLEWLASAEFAINNKVYLTTKVSLFMANYKQELRMEENIRKKGKVEKATEFVERLKKVQEAGETLRKVQEKMKRYANRKRKEIEEQSKGDRVLLSTKDLVFKEIPVRKLVDQYIGPYTIEEVVSTNTVKLRLLTSMRIHLVMNVSQIVRYREQVKGQEKKEGKPIEVAEVEEWEIEKILNKKRMREVNKYLVHQKGFTAENDTWEREEDLGNAKKLVDKFKKRLGTEVRRQEKVETERRIKDNLRTEKYRRSELLGKYRAKLLYSWDDRRFEKEYLRKLEKNWQRWKSVSPEEKP